MKKILFIVLALVAFASCSKDELNTKDIETPITFTASIESDTKTTVDGTGKVAWVIGDEVTISDGTNTGVYSVSSVGEHRFATFTYKRGTEFKTSGNYTAKYGNVNDQWYVSGNSGSNCPMSAASVSATSGATCQFTFTNDCGIVAVTANTGNVEISKIIIGSRSLNFAVSTKLNGTYLVAVPGGESFSTVTFVKSDGSKATKNIAPASVATNQLRDLKTGEYFKNATYSGFEPIALPGIFTVGTDGHKVQFAKGNLYWDGTSYKFEENQYDTRTSYDANHVTHFYRYYYGATKQIYGSEAYDNIYAYSKSEKGKDELAVNHILDGYRILTKDEFNYLVETSKKTQNCNTKSIDGKPYKCLLIYPDGYTGSKDESTWEAINNLSIVFLPVSGYRNATGWNNASAYGYLMMGPSTGYESNAYNYGNGTAFNTMLGGFLVRLVKDVK